MLETIDTALETCNIRFAHPYFLTWNGGTKTIRRYTIAYVVDRDTRSISFGVSVCAPTEQFVKADGRARAVERLTFDPTVLQMISRRATFAHPIQTIEEYLCVAAELGIVVPGLPSKMFGQQTFPDR